MDIESRIREIVAEEVSKYMQVSQPAQTPAVPQPAAAPPVPVPPAAAPPVRTSEAIMSQAFPTPPVAPPPGAPTTVPAGVPIGSPAAAPPVQAVPTLDDIKALANDFHRKHPDRVAEVISVLAEAGATKMDEIPAEKYIEVHKKIKDIAGVQ